MKYIKLAVIMVASFLVVSCSSNPKKAEVVPGPGKIAQTPKPEWVDKGSGVFSGEPNSIIYGIGVANSMPNIALQRITAENRARADIATTINTSIQALVRDFMEHHVDYFNPDAAGSDELVSYISKSVSDAVLINSRIVDHWQDPDTGALYSLARIDLNDSIYNDYKEKMKEAIRNQHRAVVKEKMDEALKALDTEVEKQRQREKEILGVK